MRSAVSMANLMEADTDIEDARCRRLELDQRGKPNDGANHVK